MPLSEVLTLAALIFLAALLYSSVGHAGASGYLAAMALFGVSAQVMKPTALSLNLLVATIATVQFIRAGSFSWPRFWPFALGSIPLAFLGGAMHVPGSLYKPLVGIVLLFGAVQLVRSSLQRNEAGHEKVVAPNPIIAVLCGAGIGLLAGLTGTGGGIFLSPLLLFMGWAQMRGTAGVSAAFILVNSAAGLAGNWASVRALPPAIPVWAIAAVLGGVIGSHFGSRRLGNRTLRRLLAIVLVVAGLKLILVRQ